MKAPIEAYLPPSALGSRPPEIDRVSRGLQAFDFVRSWTCRAAYARSMKVTFDEAAGSRAHTEVQRACRALIEGVPPVALSGEGPLDVRLERAREALILAALADEVARMGLPPRQATDQLTEALRLRARHIADGVGLEQMLLAGAAPRTSMAWKGLAEAARRCGHPLAKELEARGYEAAEAYALERGSLMAHGQCGCGSSEERRDPWGRTRLRGLHGS